MVHAENGEAVEVGRDATFAAGLLFLDLSGNALTHASVQARAPAPCTPALLPLFP